MTREVGASPFAFSLIIPTRNRAGMLVRALESVARAVVPGDPVEVIVVDNGSTDDTPDVFKAVSERIPSLAWRYFYDDMPGLLTGRHRGAREASGDVLCYLDDDVLLGATWLGAIREAFQDPGIALAGGPSRALFEVTPPLWLEDLWQELDGGRMLDSLSLIDYGSSKRSVEPYFVWGLNFAVRKQVLHECGGFHPDGVPSQLLRFRGDGEGGLSFKIKERGLQTLYHPDAAVTHIIPASRLTVRAFEQRAFSQGISDSYTRIRRERSMPSPPVRSWKETLWGMKRSLDRVALGRGRRKRMRELMAQAHGAGVAFHQEEVRHDPVLLEWVLKEDYFDYTLPAGWERHLRRTGKSSRNESYFKYRKRVHESSRRL